MRHPPTYAYVSTLEQHRADVSWINHRAATNKQRRAERYLVWPSKELNCDLHYVQLHTTNSASTYAALVPRYTQTQMYPKLRASNVLSPKDSCRRETLTPKD